MMYAVSRRRGPTLFGCGAILLLTLVVVLVAVGWWRNWYDVSGRDDAQQTEFGVRIHKEEVQRDFDILKDETQRLTESAQVAADLTTIEGVVSETSPTQVTVRVGEREHLVAIDDVTEVYVADEEASLQSVQQGDQVRVTYQETDGQKRASRIRVLRDAPQPPEPQTPQPQTSAP